MKSTKEIHQRVAHIMDCDFVFMNKTFTKYDYEKLDFPNQHNNARKIPTVITQNTNELKFEKPFYNCDVIAGLGFMT